MTSVPRWEPDGTESPAERTDPLLPAITDDMLPPLDLPPVPTLDDRTLAQMLAELDGADPALSGDPASSADPALSGDPASSGDPTSSGDAASSGDPTRPADPASSGGRPLPGGPAPRRDPPLASRTGEPPLRLVGHPAASNTRPRAASSTVSSVRNASKYVRRDLRSPQVDPDALSLTGLSRRSRGRVGSMLFKALFVGIFLLILIQAIVSLLTPGT